MLRVVLAVDSPGFRRVLRHAIELQPDMEIVGEAADGLELLEVAGGARPDVVIHNWLDGGEVPGTCVLLLAEQPHLIVVGVPQSGEHAFVCRRAISVTTLAKGGLEEILEEIRRPLLLREPACSAN